MELERIKPSGINKDVSPRALDQAGNRLIVNPCIDRQNSRFRSAETGEIGAEQNIPGTVLKSNTIPAGTNLTIGSYYDREGGRIIYFNHNSSNNHGIYTWNPITNAFTTVIQNSLLAFSNNPRYRITGIGMTGNLLCFSDGLNPPRQILIGRDYSSITTDAPINIYKRPPVKGPKVENDLRIGLSTSSFTGWSQVDPGVPGVSWTVGSTAVSTLSTGQISKILRIDAIINPGKYNFRLTLVDKTLITSTIQLVALNGSDSILTALSLTTIGENNFELTLPSGTQRIGFLHTPSIVPGPNSTVEISPELLAYTVSYLIKDASKKTSSIAGNIYQFATRYLYQDSEVSAFSQWSIPMNAYPSDTLTKYLFNGMRMNIHLQAELSLVVKKVQLLYRKNNSAEWYLYSEHAPADFTAGALQVDFFDDNSSTLIPPSESSKFFDLVPLISKALATFKNRNFLVADQEGYNITQTQDYTATLTQERVLLSLKEGGAYSYSLIYYDKDMRTVGATKLKKVSLQFQTANASGVDLSLRTVLRITLNDNNHPSWAKYVTLARSLEQNFQSYMQLPVKPVFYMSEGDLKDAAGSTIALPGTAEKYNNGKVYRNALPNNSSNKFYKIHWQVPENIPFVPDSACFIRVLTPLTGLTKEDTTSVIAFDGQSIITNNIANLNWSTSGYTPADGLLIEVFKFKTEPLKFLYELSEFTQELPLGSVPFNHASTLYDWDTFINDIQIPYTAKFLFKNMKIDGVASDTVYDKDALLLQKNLESPAGIFNNVDESQDSLNKTYSSFASQQVSNTPDYTRIPDYPGRAIAYNSNPQQIAKKTTVRFSGPFIQDSQINSLSSFGVADEYPLPNYRTPVLKLQPAGNVLLAIHERYTTSMYVGEGFIKNADGTEVLSKTDSVIGQDREMTTGFGSYHPESIAEWGSMVFGFDIFKGVVWRYDNNGQQSISEFGMQSYFWNKANDYLQYKDTVAILGGIDPYHREYLIHFPAAGDFAAETWAFNFASNEWVGRQTFSPEAMCYINNLFVSFKSGQLWVHNQDRTNYNTFYGVKSSRKVTVAVNPFPSRVKCFESMQISAEQLTEGDSYPVLHFANVAAFPGSGAANTRYHAQDTDRYYTWNGASYDNISEVQIVTGANREGQATYMKRKEFEKFEGVFNGPILRDTNTSDGLMTAGRLKLRDGKYMLSQVLELTIENNSKGVARQHYFNVGYTHSKLSV